MDPYRSYISQHVYKTYQMIQVCIYSNALMASDKKVNYTSIRIESGLYLRPYRAPFSGTLAGRHRPSV